MSRPVGPLGPMLEKKYQPIIERVRQMNGLGEAPAPHRRRLAFLFERQRDWIESMIRTSGLREAFGGMAGTPLVPVSLTETTTSADIATITSQILAIVDVIYERLMVDQLLGIGLGTMSGPTGIVSTIDHKQESAGTVYSAGSSLNDGLDTDFSDCPTDECGEAEGVDYERTNVTVTAICKRLKADWCVPAEQDEMSQYGNDLASTLRFVIANQIRREIQGEVLNLLVSNAGYNENWSETPAGGSVYADLDPRVWQRTLYEAIVSADVEVFKSTDGRVGTDWMAGTPDALKILLQLKDFAITVDNQTSRDAAGEGGVEEYANFFGTANARWGVYTFPFMTENTILLGRTARSAQEIAHIHRVYVPLSDLGLLTYPGQAKREIGMITRYANRTIRSGLLATVTIT